MEKLPLPQQHLRLNDGSELWGGHGVLHEVAMGSFVIAKTGIHRRFMKKGVKMDSNERVGVHMGLENGKYQSRS